MKLLKAVGLALCAISLSAFVVASADAQDQKPMMKKHHHHQHHHHHAAGKSRTTGKH